ncbi:FAD-dependent oxidoreductase [Streptobacillus canis]|uniref:FAD-dependent oxidoreductase n=1 Tax=Streptobacillus canis TaxID=2678686 RepID=UPI0012E1A001|nr:FAD-dependent oxidoreductase [Streptobacillus canis]
MKKIYDLIIIGSGPAGLSAGIYAGRSKLDVLILEKDNKGGQIAITDEIVNYPGIAKSTGAKLMKDMREQAISFGVNFVTEEVMDMNFSEDIKVVKTLNNEYEALSVVIATGAAPRKLGFKGEEEFTGRGVAYCATCDGEFFTGLDIYVIGAGFAAAEEAMFLTKYGKSVTIIAREPEFTCAKSIADKVKAHPKINIKFNTELLELIGDTKPRKAIFKNNITGEITELNTDKTFGVFVFVGYAPISDIFKGHVEIDKNGFIPTNELLETNIRGIYAAGDIRPKSLRQVVTAVADGAIASTSIEKYVYELREHLGLQKKEENVVETVIEKKVFLDENLKAQLSAVASKFSNSIELVYVGDGSHFENNDILNAVTDIANCSDKIKLTILNKGDNPEVEAKIKLEKTPTIAILDKSGEFSGIKYSTIPGGHELNSFILGMYNVAGPGQPLTQDRIDNINKVDKKVSIKVGISLSCTKCPKVVQSTQKIATINNNIDVEVINIFSFPEFKDKYNIMSVPAMIIEDKVYFGEKGIEEIIEVIK